jgi:protein-tyrosine phosphatase
VFEVHYHLLYGVDDGPETLEESLALAEASISEGVTHIIATPHANNEYPFQPEVNRARLEQLKDLLGDRLTLGLGCDFHLSYENIQDLIKNPTKYSINGGQYLLVEFPDFGIPPSILDTFYAMQVAGVVPILTHPERNPTLIANPNRIAEWIRCGCLVQVTAGALIGRFGRRSEHMAHELVQKNWVHLIASDAHNLRGRSPKMARAYDLLKEKYGQETADRLCIHNPRAVFFGEELPGQPEPIGVYETAQRTKRGFFKSLLGGR